MADIKSFFKEKEQRRQDQDTYKDKIMQHKMANLYRVLIVMALIGCVAFFVFIQYKRHIYTTYDRIFTTERIKASDSKDLRLGNAVLTYSKDGAHCTDSKGNVTWNQTYEMQDIKVAQCQNVVAIANYNGRTIYVNSTTEQLGQIDTPMPIRIMSVSANGTVSAVLADTDTTWINTYDAKGELLYTGQTHMSNSGYPMAISLSPNGEMLGVSYIYVDAGVIKTNVAFYNFGPVGANQSDYVVSVYSYPDLLVPEICFMDNQTAFAVGDSRLMIYRGGQKPVLAGEFLYSEEVKSVFHSDKYVGLVFASDDMEHRYRLRVFDSSAREVGSYYFDMDYTDVILNADNFVIYNDRECMITTYGGKEKYKGTFDKTVNQMIPVASSYRYVLVTDDSIDMIQLK